MRPAFLVVCVLLAACGPNPAPASDAMADADPGPLTWQALIPPGSQPASLYYMSPDQMLPLLVFSCFEGHRVKVAMADEQGAPRTSFSLSSGDSARRFDADPASSDNVLGFSQPVAVNDPVLATFRASGGLSAGVPGVQIRDANPAERAQIESFFAACERS